MPVQRVQSELRPCFQCIWWGPKRYTYPAITLSAFDACNGTYATRQKRRSRTMPSRRRSLGRRCTKISMRNALNKCTNTRNKVECRYIRYNRSYVRVFNTYDGARNGTQPPQSPCQRLLHATERTLLARSVEPAQGRPNDGRWAVVAPRHLVLNTPKRCANTRNKVECR